MHSVSLSHPVTERDTLFASHLVVAIGARRLDALERAHEDDAAPAPLRLVRGLGLPAAGAGAKDVHPYARLRPDAERVEGRRVAAVGGPIALLRRGDRAERAL